MASKAEDFCSENFNFEDFVSCSETFQNVSVDNVPCRDDTYKFIRQLANDILEPCLSKFGHLKLTYGFCGKSLSRAIKNRNGGIFPPLDQHAGMELNASGDLICSRGVWRRLSLSASIFVTSCEICCGTPTFDRLYFYGDNRSVHVCEH